MMGLRAGYSVQPSPNSVCRKCEQYSGQSVKQPVKAHSPQDIVTFLICSTDKVFYRVTSLQTTFIMMSSLRSNMTPASCAIIRRLPPPVKHIVRSAVLITTVSRHRVREGLFSPPRRRCSVETKMCKRKKFQCLQYYVIFFKSVNIRCQIYSWVDG